MSTPQEEQKDFDILEMPSEGLAAYWLSIKKLIDVKRSKKILEEEIRYTREPFIKHMLETTFSGIDEQSIRRLALAKRETIIIDYERKLAAMSIAILAVSSKENPRVSFVRMASHFPFVPITEKKAFSLAQGIGEGLSNKDSNHEVLLEIDHKLQNDRLLVKLLYHIITARRGGKQTLEKYLPFIKTPFYLNGLTQTIDGFDHRILKANLAAQSKEILRESSRKMEMATEMCIGIKNKLSYDDIFKIAKSYMP